MPSQAAPPPSAPPRRIVIIGGGASGVLAAAASRHAANRASAAVQITIVESAPTVGRGVAYGTAREVHLLNTRADVMSAHADDPGHFTRWCASQGFTGAGDAGGVGESYQPRPVYAQYLGSVVTELVGFPSTNSTESLFQPANTTKLSSSSTGHAGDAAASGQAQVKLVTGVAVGVSRSDRVSSVRLSDGRELSADRVILAVGHGPPATLPTLRTLAESPVQTCYVADPWRAGAFDDLATREPVLLVGTGLTAVDVLLSLDEMGHRGPVTAVSRHGLLPTDHITARAQPVQVRPDLRTAATALRSVRALVTTTTAAGGDWRAVMDGLRHSADELWSVLSEHEQRRFLRSVLRYWEIHRHRMAPTVAQLVHRHLASDRFQVLPVAGFAVRADSSGGAEVTLHGVTLGDVQARRYGRIINCTGPTSPLRAPSPLIAQLLTDGYLLPDPLRLGVATDARAAAVVGDGDNMITHDWLRVLGPLRRGRGCWETTAVPDIRAHAAIISET